MSKILPPGSNDFYGHNSDLIIQTIKIEAPPSYQVGGVDLTTSDF